MAKYATLVEETTDVTGTNSMPLNGATPGHRAIGDVFSNNDWVHYLLRSEDKTLFERGYGRYVSGSNQLTRTYPREPTMFSPVGFPIGNHTVTITPNPDIAHPGGYLIDYPLTEDIVSGVATKLTWVTTSPVYDTDNRLPLSSYSDLPLPDWVSKIRVSVGIMIKENADGGRSLWMEGANTGGWYGLPRIDCKGHLTPTTFQYMQWSSGIIDVDIQLQQRTFSIWVQQDSGVDLEVRGAGPTTGHLLCEYAE